MQRARCGQRDEEKERIQNIETAQMKINSQLANTIAAIIHMHRACVCTIRSEKFSKKINVCECNALILLLHTVKAAMATYRKWFLGQQQ